MEVTREDEEEAVLMAHMTSISGRLLLCLCAASAACSKGLFSRDLTRGRAQQLLAAELSKTVVTQGTLAKDEVMNGCNEAVDAGVYEQLWTVPRERAGALSEVPLALTPKGKQFFREVTVEIALLVGCTESSVALVKPMVGQLLQVVGIRQDGEDKRVAEFQWKIDAPPVVLRYLGAKAGPIASEAAFQRYDDGWRLTSVDDSANAPSRFVRDPQAEAEERARVEAERTKAEAARRERDERWRLARTVTTTLGTYHLERSSPERGFGTVAGTDLYDIQVTDAGFVVKHTERSRSGAVSGSSSYWWWQVIAIDATDTAIKITFRVPESFPLMLEKSHAEFADDGTGGGSIADAAKAMREAWASWRERFPEFVQVAESVQAKQ